MKMLSYVKIKFFSQAISGAARPQIQERNLANRIRM